MIRPTAGSSTCRSTDLRSCARRPDAGSSRAEWRRRHSPCPAGILTHPATSTLRPYRDIPLRATLLGWLASPLQDASDEAVCFIEQFPGFLAPGTIMAASRDLRPMLYRAVAPFLRDHDEDVREAAVVTALILVEHPALGGEGGGAGAGAG